jgi:hypothetical protein
MTAAQYERVDVVAYKVRLNVPFAKRAAVCAAGARWFSSLGAWYVAYDTPAFYECRPYWEDADKWEMALRADAAFPTRRIHLSTHRDDALKCTWIYLGGV